MLIVFAKTRPISLTEGSLSEASSLTALLPDHLLWH